MVLTLQLTLPVRLILFLGVSANDEHVCLQTLGQQGTRNMHVSYDVREYDIVATNAEYCSTWRLHLDIS